MFFVLIGLALVMSACGGPKGSSSHGSVTTSKGSGNLKAASSPTTAAGSCSGASPSHEVGIVVQPSAALHVSRCVSVPGTTISAVEAMRRSGVEESTQKYSFGMAVCQLDNVPAHYSACLPSGAPYWALFVSKHGGSWQQAQVGVSQLTLSAGESIGWRYDPAKGTAKAPSVQPPLR